MLLKTCFVINVNGLDENISRFKLPHNASLNLYVKTAEDFQKIVKRIYSLSIRTSFFISFDKSLLSNLIEDEFFFELIVPIFFHYKYVQNQFNIPLLGLKDSYDDSFDQNNIIQKMRLGLNKNGYLDINYLLLPEEGIAAWDEINPLETNRTFRSAYMKALLSAESVNNYFFIEIDRLSSLNVIIDEMLETEGILFNERPGFYTLLKNFSDTEREKAIISLKSKALSQRLDSVQNYYSFQNLSELDSRKRISQIVDFYKKEYEILPGWYKKFGHILKVFMGKRSFQSLFNDNVKKYKE